MLTKTQKELVCKGERPLNLFNWSPLIFLGKETEATFANQQLIKTTVNLKSNLKIKYQNNYVIIYYKLLPTIFLKLKIFSSEICLNLVKIVEIIYLLIIYSNFIHKSTILMYCDIFK